MTVGKKKVKVRTIPYTNHKITVKWDPILTKRETETAMFQMMKSSKKRISRITRGLTSFLVLSCTSLLTAEILQRLTSITFMSTFIRI